jgi:hypothetical protein
MATRNCTIHFLYMTTCTVTGKYYVGMHSTDQVDDGYLGSGLVLDRSVKKHGADAHKREILEFYPDRSTLTAKEALVVGEALLSDPLCMNLRGGGAGEEGMEKRSKSLKGKKQPWTSIRNMGNKYGLGKKHTEEWKANMRGKKHALGTRHDLAFSEMCVARNKARIGRYSEENIEAIVASNKHRGDLPKYRAFERTEKTSYKMWFSRQLKRKRRVFVEDRQGNTLVFVSAITLDEIQTVYEANTISALRRPLKELRSRNELRSFLGGKENAWKFGAEHGARISAAKKGKKRPTEISAKAMAARKRAYYRRMVEFIFG